MYVDFISVHGSNRRWALSQAQVWYVQERPDKSENIFIAFVLETSQLHANSEVTEVQVFQAVPTITKHFA